MINYLINESKSSDDNLGGREATHQGSGLLTGKEEPPCFVYKHPACSLRSLAHNVETLPVFLMHPCAQVGSLSFGDSRTLNP
jgi:hypothetical protein